MSYAEYISVMEAIWTALAMVGIGLGLYLLRAERQDRAIAIAANGPAGILSWALVTSETLRVVGQIIVFGFGVAALTTPNLTAPATPIAPFLSLMVVLFVAIGVAQSGVLIYARKRIAHYPVAPTGLAKEETLLAVQHDVEDVSVKVGETKEAAHAAYETANDVNKKIENLAEKISDLAKRATVSERRADAAEEREK